MAKYDDFKLLRNKIRKYDPSTIIVLCIQKLHEISKKPVYENRSYLPWELLYLIKIAFIEGGKNEKRIANINDMNTLLNLVKDLGSESSFLNGERGGMRKFMRTLAFQQFWFQRGVASYDMARQVLIFDKVAGADLHEQFLACTGMSIETYLQLLVACWCGFIDNSGRIHIKKDWFASLGCRDEMLDSFLESISLSVKDTIEFLERQYEKTEDKLLQLTEQTPLKQFPFVLTDDRYYCYSPHVLQEKIKHAIYDILKEAYKDRFTQRFGTLYEEYIYKLMDSCGLKYIKENELAKAFKKRRVTDAIIELEDSVVILEVKGVEMHPLAKINPTNAVMTKYLETNIIKSFEQIYEMANTLRTSPEGKAIADGKDIYALVVTYKEMYLSDGRDLWEEFLAKPLQAYIYEKNLDMSHLALENILFSSVNAFEDIIKIILANGNILTDVISTIVKDNSAPETKKFLLEMHLKQYQHCAIPLLEDAFETVAKGLEDKLS